MEEITKKERDSNPGQHETTGNVCLEDLAYLIDFPGDSHIVIEDKDLLEFARRNGISPQDAQIEALRSKIIPLRYVKNVRALSLAEQSRLSESRVLVCGCGGLGGAVINLLARAGVGTLRLVDGGIFVPSHLNRQWFCNTQEISKPKAEVTGAQVRTINPFIEVEVFATLMDENNTGSFIEGMDLVIDALDDLAGHFQLAEAAKRMGVTFIHAAAVGWWGQISTFLPESFLDLHSVYGHGEEQDQADAIMGVLGPAPAIIGGLVTFEAIRLLCGKNSAYADQLCYLDGENGRMDVIPLE